MLTMTSYSFGDIVLVPFPFTDQTSAKKRPAVVISSDVYNQEHPDLIVMAITSQRYIVSMVGDVAVTYWNEAGLLKPSVIKAIVATVEKGLVVRKLGQLQETDREALQDALQIILGE